MNSQKKIVLASQSKYRKALLDKLHIAFEQDAANIDESERVGETPLELVERLAIEKARTVAARHADSVIIASDQLAAVDGVILTKPGNFDNAKQQLQQLSGKTVVFHTSLCVMNSSDGSHKTIIEDVNVKFRELSDSIITRYLELEHPYDCVGSFKSEGLGIVLFDAIESCDPNTLIGLPMIQLVKLLESQSYSIPPN